MLIVITTNYYSTLYVIFGKLGVINKHIFPLFSLIILLALLRGKDQLIILSCRILIISSTFEFGPICIVLKAGV